MGEARERAAGVPPAALALDELGGHPDMAHVVALAPDLMFASRIASIPSEHTVNI